MQEIINKSNNQEKVRTILIVQKKMKVFISWSGEKSGEVAQSLYDWLKNVFQTVDFYISKENINKGSYAGTEKSCRGAHVIADDNGNNKSSCHDSKKLLNCEDDERSEFNLVIYVVNEFHRFLLQIVNTLSFGYKHKMLCKS